MYSYMCRCVCVFANGHTCYVYTLTTGLLKAPVKAPHPRLWPWPRVRVTGKRPPQNPLPQPLRNLRLKSSPYTLLETMCGRELTPQTAPAVDCQHLFTLTPLIRKGKRSAPRWASQVGADIGDFCCHQYGLLLKADEPGWGLSEGFPEQIR